jgi:hypothetical protein
MTLRILIVEDDHDYRAALCHIFNLEGFSADGLGPLQRLQPGETRINWMC